MSPGDEHADRCGLGQAVARVAVERGGCDPLRAQHEARERDPGTRW